jgi:hypothetical protein
MTEACYVVARQQGQVEKDYIDELRIPDETRSLGDLREARLPILDFRFWILDLPILDFRFWIGGTGRSDFGFWIGGRHLSGSSSPRPRAWMFRPFRAQKYIWRHDAS